MIELNKVKVLDHGYVCIVDKMGNDESIVEAARMSTGKGFISWDPYVRCKKCGACWWSGDGKMGLLPGHSCEKCCDQVPFAEVEWEKYPNGDLGLLDTLWRKKHATPFEMGELVIEVQAPIMVFREWHRHRTQSYNELSARYAMMPNLHYLPDASRIQKQSATNKQGSAELMGAEFAAECLGTLGEEQQLVYEEYEYMVEQGLAKEVARINTPVSRYSKMRAKGNIRNWFQFLNLRMRPDAQWEIRMYANEVSKILQQAWPKAYALFEEYDLYGAYFSRTELKILRRNIGLGGLHMAASTELNGTKLKEFMEKVEFGGEKIL